MNSRSTYTGWSSSLTITRSPTRSSGDGTFLPAVPQLTDGPGDPAYIDLRVPGNAHCEIEAERLVRHHPDLVGHHRHPVQRRLPVEQDDVAVDELPLDRVAELDRFRDDLGVLLRHANPTSIRPDHVIHAGNVLPERPEGRRAALDP